ncbi:MAG TPA: hypothetical protein VJ891_10045 [Casimicrobiaceae bacterium]|nr:hypothetical protein [Casimicrobiaceae bacterium]
MAGATRVRLGPVQGTSADDVIFALNPDRIPREYGAVYAQVPIAGADYAPSSPVSNPPPVAWVRNQADRIHADVLLVAPKILNGSGPDDVESDIRKLEIFRFKDRSGEPPDLVFTVGPRSDRVRLERMQVDPKIWTEDLRIQQARVTLELIVVRPRYGS